MPAPRTEVKDVYRASRSTGTDLNPTFEGCTLVASAVPCNIQRGSRGAMEKAMAFGRDPQLSSAGFFNFGDLATLQADYFLVGGSDPVYRIIGHPEPHNRFPATAHVEVLLEALNYIPDGITRQFVDVVSVEMLFQVALD